MLLASLHADPACYKCYMFHIFKSHTCILFNLSGCVIARTWVYFTNNNLVNVVPACV